MLFKGGQKIDVNVSQIVVVESDTQYDFEGFVKTSNLQSAGTPVLQILDATDGAVLGSSPPAPAGSNDWQRISIGFKTGGKAEAIVIHISRGRVWREYCLFNIWHCLV